MFSGVVDGLHGLARALTILAVALWVQTIVVLVTSFRRRPR